MSDTRKEKGQNGATDNNTIPKEDVNKPWGIIKWLSRFKKE